MIELLLERAKSLKRLIDQEIKNTILYEEYDYEKELQFLAFRVTVELKFLYYTFCNKILIAAVKNQLRDGRID